MFLFKFLLSKPCLTNRIPIFACLNRWLVEYASRNITRLESRDCSFMLTQLFAKNWFRHVDSPVNHVNTNHQCRVLLQDRTKWWWLGESYTDMTMIWSWRLNVTFIKLLKFSAVLKTFANLRKFYFWKKSSKHVFRFVYRYCVRKLRICVHASFNSLRILYLRASTIDMTELHELVLMLT